MQTQTYLYHPLLETLALLIDQDLEVGLGEVALDALQHA